MTLHIEDPGLLGDPENDSPVVERTRSLCKVDDGSVFAYVERGNEFLRVSDHQLWATERDGTLYSARSGQPLARRRGKVYFELETDTPLYYVRAV